MNINYREKYNNQIKINERKYYTAHIIYLLRTLNELTQKEVADLIEIKDKTYRTYEVGRSETPQEIIIRLAQLYEVPTDFILQNTIMNITRANDDKLYAISPSTNDYISLKHAKMQLEQLGIKKTNKTYIQICKTIEKIEESALIKENERINNT